MSIVFFVNDNEPVELYNPAQPRNPAGSPIGGQWASGDGSQSTMESFRKRVSTIAKEAPGTKPDKERSARVDKAFSLGESARRSGISTVREANYHDAYYKHMQYFETAEMVSFEAGIQGKEKPYWVDGWRYGPVPSSGASKNYALGVVEPGVSLMGTKNGLVTADVGFELFTKNRDIYFVSGFLNTVKTGSDGEPLVLWAKQTGRRK
jgi:hypothetical protein